MRSKSNDFFSTILMLIPLVAVPMLAIFGIPEISPVKKSTLSEKDSFNGTGSGDSQTEEISFGSTTSEIDLGGESNISQDSRLDHNHATSANVFDKMASSKEEWLPPSGALDGWEPEPISSRPKNDQKMIGFSTSNSEQTLERSLDSEPVSQAFFESNQSSQEKTGANNTEIQQVKNDVNPFEQKAPSPRKAVKEVDQQFRLRAEKLLRRDPATWSAAVEKLNELGIRDYRLEPGVRPNDFLFSCSYSPPQNPRISRRFEAEAIDPLIAVIHVLQQVDEWNQNR